MVRPLRVEYENAYYHVMNRGRGRQHIFHTEAYYQLFLETLAEAHSRFGLQVLCYCLMSNHYHLLVKTPRANLSRCMRHVNGVYTQRYNRLRPTDGPLFRGRYQAIVVESDSYQLQLSRYIHRNPIESKLVTQSEDYPWSSYPIYLNKGAGPDWLYRDEILDQVGNQRNRYDHYRAYVQQGIDEEIRLFYARENLMSVLGSDAFREEISAQRESSEVAQDVNSSQPIAISDIVVVVAKKLHVEPATIIQAKRGRGEKNLARWISMFLCQELGDYRLAEIAEAFGLARYATVSTTIAKLKRDRKRDKDLDKLLKRMVLDLS